MRRNDWNDWNDLTSLDYLSLSPREREEVKREAIRRAFEERARMMDTIFMALPRLIRGVFVRLTARKRSRPVVISRKQILQV